MCDMIMPKGDDMKKFWLFVLAVLISFVPGIIGVMFTPSHSDDLWYNALNNSVLTPDGWVFGVAWTILYALLGVALYMIMISAKTRQNKALAYVLFVVQMGLNALWTYLFFGMHFIGAALICLVALLGVAIWMTIAFKPISKAAAYLVWPYVGWLVFALYLNGTIVLLN